ncbi:hypothetical protein JXE04_01110 [Patescibacteria group bacterium]|nr:hypothetical protein [Patescibacteria group bacterium]
MKKYRLGNQPEEYELREDYIGFVPENVCWGDLIFDFIKNVKLNIFHNSSGEKRVIFLHNFIIKDAFPMSFYSEERASLWNDFAIISETETSEKFIIPVLEVK